MLRSASASRGDTPARENFSSCSHRRLHDRIEQRRAFALHRSELNLSDCQFRVKHSTHLNGSPLSGTRLINSAKTGTPQLQKKLSDEPTYSELWRPREGLQKAR